MKNTASLSSVASLLPITRALRTARKSDRLGRGMDTSKLEIPCSIFDICFLPQRKGENMTSRLLLHSLLCALCVSAVNSSFCRAQQKDAPPTPGDVMIDKYLAQETDKLSQRFLD